MHAFVDESERSSYLLVCTLLVPAQLHPARTLMRGMLMGGERRLHFKKETDSRRRHLLSKMADFGGLQTHVYVCKGSGEVARGTALQRLLTDSLNHGVTRLVLEARDAAGNARDRAIVARTGVAEKGLVYEHIPASGEPALWISDAVAWCYGAGGDWIRRVKPLIADVIEVEAAESARPRRRPSGRAPGPTSKG